MGSATKVARRLRPFGTIGWRIPVIPPVRDAKLDQTYIPRQIHLGADVDRNDLLYDSLTDAFMCSCCKADARVPGEFAARRRPTGPAGRKTESADRAVELR